MKKHKVHQDWLSGGEGPKPPVMSWKLRFGLALGILFRPGPTMTLIIRRVVAALKCGETGNSDTEGDAAVEE